ncbi:hypothetical protein PAMA_016257 [Pampus argenteus]
MFNDMIPTYREMFTICAIAFLCLMSGSHSAPLECEDLVKALDQLDSRHLEGRWALVSGGFSDPELLELFKHRNSSSINVSFFPGTSDISYTPTVEAGGKCFSQPYNVSVEGSILTFDAQYQINLTVTFIYTSCPDCLVMRYDTETKKVQRLFLFSRRREVEQNEMDEFRAQVKCLKMSPPVVLDPTKELCPEQSVEIKEKQ